MNDGNGTVDPVQRAEDGENNGVITTEAGAVVRKLREWTKCGGEGETYVTIFGCSLLSFANGHVEPTMSTVSSRATSRCKSVE